MEMSKLIVGLEVASRKCLQSRKKILPVVPAEVRLLWLVQNGHSSPSVLVDELCINKSNLATLCRHLCTNGLLQKNKSKNDKREISLTLTKRGQDFLTDALSELEQACTGAFGSGYQDALAQLRSAFEVLELI